MQEKISDNDRGAGDLPEHGIGQDRPSKQEVHPWKRRRFYGDAHESRVEDEAKHDHDLVTNVMTKVGVRGGEERRRRLVCRSCGKKNKAK